jgi:hypothetical protein
VVYLDESGTLKLRPDGVISYTASDDGGMAYPDDTADMVEASRAILSEIHEAFSGDEELFYTGFKRDGDSCAISFGYFVEGAEVKYNTESAASVVFEGGRLTQLKLKIRSYTMTEEKAYVLPEYQAAAIAGSKVKGAEAKLVWCDGGGDNVAIGPRWVAD